IGRPPLAASQRATELFAEPVSRYLPSGEKAAQRTGTPRVSAFHFTWPLGTSQTQTVSSSGTGLRGPAWATGRRGRRRPGGPRAGLVTLPIPPLPPDVRVGWGNSDAAAKDARRRRWLFPPLLLFLIQKQRGGIAMLIPENRAFFCVFGPPGGRAGRRRGQ